MGVSYSLGLWGDLTSEAIREFVATIPNDGITEILDERVVDLSLRDDQLHEAPTDGGGGEVYEWIEGVLRREGGTLSHDTAFELELAGCFVVEGLGRAGRTGSVRFGDRPCFDLAFKAAEARGLLDELGPEDARATELVALVDCLRRAASIHCVVVFSA